MKKNWLYACLLAIAVGMFSFTATSCRDKDDKPEEGEVVVTPDPEVEYYIMGTVTESGQGLANVEVKVNTKTVKTDVAGKFSITETATGSYAIEAAPAGYIPQKTSVEIAANAGNRSVVTVSFSLTRQSKTQNVAGNVGGEVTDNSSSNMNVGNPGETDPNDVAEDALIATAEIAIPAGALPKTGTGINEDGSADISVTTYVPAPEKVTTKVEVANENKGVEKSIPLAAAHFVPTGLKFEKPVVMSIANPLSSEDDEVTLDETEMRLTYLNAGTGKWETKADKVTYNEATQKYEADIHHFSSYAMESVVNQTVSEEKVLKEDILGQDSYDNTKNAKAVTGIALKYTEKAGWEYNGNVVAIVKAALPGISTITANAIAVYLKTRMYAAMGSLSGVTRTERTYNTVNVNGYTMMNYVCYAKIRTTTLKVNVKHKGKKVPITLSAIRYTGADHQYTTVTYKPGHGGGQGGTN